MAESNEKAIEALIAELTGEGEEETDALIVDDSNVFSLNELEENEEEDNSFYMEEEEDELPMSFRLGDNESSSVFDDMADANELLTSQYKSSNNTKTEFNEFLDNEFQDILRDLKSDGSRNRDVDLTDTLLSGEQSTLTEVDDESYVDEIQENYEKTSASRSFDLQEAIPTLSSADLTEYVLVDGVFSKPFKEFMKSYFLLPDGDFPIAIKYGDTPIHYRNFNPEPKNIYLLKKILEGFTLTLVTPEGSKELTPFALMNRCKYTLEVK